MSDKPPNILWFCTDQQRHDTIGALGNAEVRTPALDRLCHEGIAFERCYAQSPICTPSRASMLTGRYPASHHVHRNGTERFPAGETLVSGLLADAGYTCGLVGKLHLSAMRQAEKRPDGDGFSTFAWNGYPRHGALDGNAYAQWLRDTHGLSVEEAYRDSALFCGAGVPADIHQSTWAGEASERFITANRDRSWFLNVNIFDPHPPFDPPADYLARYDPDGLTPPDFRPSDIANQAFLASVPFQTRTPLDVFGPPPDPDGQGRDPDRPGQLTARPPESLDGRHVKAAYYAMIELADAVLGRIIDRLEETGQRERTLIIFSSDHGEMLGDHGLLYKGCRFYDPLVRVPLILSQPGAMQSDLRSEALAELVDVAPTIMEAAGLPASPRMQGRSLHAIATGRAGPDRHKDFVVSEYNDAQANFPAEHGTMVFDGRIKSCFYQSSGLMEVYDLKNDPGEFDNLVLNDLSAGDRADLTERHFKAWLATSDAGHPRSDLH